MTLPRQVIPGQLLFITRRCAQQQFLLKPDRVVNDAYLYCLAYTSNRHQMDVLLPTAMSNHHHLEVFDRYGNCPKFLEEFHKLTARCLNRYRGRRENFWSSAQPSVVRLGDREDALRKAVYIATNPVKANLVECASDWPGVNGLEDLLEKREIVIARPKWFFREGKLPDFVKLRFVVPPELGDADEFIAELRERVRAEEARFRDERLRAKKHVCGRKVVLKQSWKSRPAATPSMPKLNPRIAIADRKARAEALGHQRAFLVEYRVAWRIWTTGQVVPFPPGTYWLRRYARVPIADDSGATT